MQRTAAARPIQTMRDSRRRENIAGYLFMAPSLMFFLGFVIYPMVMCVGYSFSNYTLSEFTFAGLSNYKRMLGDAIYHVHAKDTRIDRERLARTGILTDFSWWAYAIPGRGELDWAKLLAALKQIGYTGTVSLEHEDALYEGSVEKVQEGLLEGKRYLESMLH